MDTISLSSYYKLDKTLKKQLILIMIAAKKPKKLSGLGFFDLELEKYTTVRNFDKVTGWTIKNTFKSTDNFNCILVFYFDEAILLI